MWHWPQIESLQGMKWRLAKFDATIDTGLANSREYSIRIFICGDYEFLSKLYGLSGASGEP